MVTSEMFIPMVFAAEAIAIFPPTIGSWTVDGWRTMDSLHVSLVVRFAAERSLSSCC